MCLGDGAGDACGCGPVSVADLGLDRLVRVLVDRLKYLVWRGSSPRLPAVTLGPSQGRPRASQVRAGALRCTSGLERSSSSRRVQGRYREGTGKVQGRYREGTGKVQGRCTSGLERSSSSRVLLWAWVSSSSGCHSRPISEPGRTSGICVRGGGTQLGGRGLREALSVVLVRSAPGRYSSDQGTRS